MLFLPEDIRERLRSKPFKPLRIIADEGLRFDIHHPDLVMVGNTDLMIGIPDPKKAGIYDGVIRVALLHIVGLEDITVSSAPTNGPTSGK